MKLVYHTTTLSFCQDLTDPNAESFPVAVLLIGKTDLGIGEHANIRVASAAAIMRDYSKMGLDPISVDILSNVLELLQHQVNRIVKTIPFAPIEKLMQFVHDGLRNSLHVSDVADQKTVDLANNSFAQQDPETFDEKCEDVLLLETVAALRAIRARGQELLRIFFPSNDPAFAPVKDPRKSHLAIPTEATDSLGTRAWRLPSQQPPTCVSA